MAFSDFTYPDILTTFGLTERTVPGLFDHVQPVGVSPEFQSHIQKRTNLAISNNTEKARGEWLIAPVLEEAWDRCGGSVSLFSGVTFAADPANGLSGYCDYLLGRGAQRMPVTAPILVAFEAKNENLYDGFPQCIAAMVGAQRFNRKSGIDFEAVYGCSTTGDNWKFLKLEGTRLSIDMTVYQLANVGRILGVILHMVGPLPQPAAA